MDDAADPVAAVDADGVEVGNRCWQGLEGCCLIEGAVRPVGVVVVLVLTKDSQQVALVPDQGLVEEFASAAADPAFHDRVRTGRLDRAAQDPDPRAGEDRVEGSGNLVSRSRRRNLIDSTCPSMSMSRLRAICVTQASLG